MVSLISLMGGNVGDEKWWDDKVISTVMEASSSDTRDGKDVATPESSPTRPGWRIRTETPGTPGQSH